MEIENLIKLGLSKTEAKIYLTLLKNQKSSAALLSEETGYYKANVYQALERLIGKGIISYIIRDKKRIYSIQRPESLIEYIEGKKADLEVQETLAIKLTKEVEKGKKTLEFKESAEVFQGIVGIKQIYSEIIREKLDYLVFGSPQISEEIIPDWYWQNLHQKQIEGKIKARMIFHKSLKHWEKLMPKEIVKLKFHDQKFEPLTETTIYGNKVALTVWTEKPTVTIINNKHVADSYRQVFEIMWKQAKS
ncbi:MAG: helix-turn-helix domain-containing protein [archaeon]